MSKPPPSARNHNSGRRSRRRWLATLTGLLVLLTALTPWLLQSLARDAILTASLDDPELTVSCESATFSWIAATSVEGLRIQSHDGRLNLTVKRLQFDRPWWKLVLDDSGLGAVELDEPQLSVALTRTEMEAIADVVSDSGGPTLSATIRRGSLQLIVDDEPTIEMQDFNLQFEIERTADSREVRMSPQVLFERRAATPEICHDLLKWFDPSLADIVSVDGAVTLAIDECRIPLDVSDEERLKDLQLQGTLRLDQFHARTSPPLLTGLIDVLSAQRSESEEAPIQILERASIDFQVQDDRIRLSSTSRGLPGVPPDVTVTSRGSIGLDESLDIVMTFPASLISHGGKESDSLAGTPSEIAITSTLTSPVIQLR